MFDWSTSPPYRLAWRSFRYCGSRKGDAMAEGSIMTQEMQDAIGKELPPSTLEVDKTGVRMFARAVGYTDEVFYDEEEAKRRGYRSLPAPPAYLGTAVYSPQQHHLPPGQDSRYTNPYKRLLNGGT